MTSLTVKCPSTGRGVSTAFDTESIDRLPKVGTRMRCPLCGEEHFWTSRDVWFGSRSQPESVCVAMAGSKRRSKMLPPVRPGT